MSSSAIPLSGFGSYRSPSSYPNRRPLLAARMGITMTVTTKRSLYNVLRVKETASSAEIKSAYRSLAKRFHPDVNPQNNGGSEFMEIRNAYTMLSDAKEREIYDISRTVGRVGFSSDQRLRVRRWETDQCW